MTFFKIAGGVFVGNLITLAVVAAIIPHIKVERRIITAVFN
jgi:hypothetical protein